MNDMFAMVFCKSPDGIDESLAVSLDKVDIVERVCNQIFGRKNVSVHRSMKVNQLPANILAALAAAERGETVDDRFATLKWIHSEIAAEQRLQSDKSGAGTGSENQPSN